MGRPFNIDTRVVTVYHDRYKLMARYWDDQYRGWAWDGREQVVALEGADIDRIIVSMIEIIDTIALPINQRRECRVP